MSGELTRSATPSGRACHDETRPSTIRRRDRFKRTASGFPPLLHDSGAACRHRPRTSARPIPSTLRGTSPDRGDRLDRGHRRREQFGSSRGRTSIVNCAASAWLEERRRVATEFASSTKRARSRLRGGRTPFDLATSRARIYMQLLDRQVPGRRESWMRAVAPASCQLLSLMERRVVASTCRTTPCARAGVQRAFQLGSARFVQMTLRWPSESRASITSLERRAASHGGRRARLRSARAARQASGHIVVGLYNRYGRLLLNARKRSSG